MQRIKLICVGKASTAFYAQGIAEYTKRLAPLCKFEAVELAEEQINEKAASDVVVNAALEKEAGRITAAIPKGATIIAMCIEGKLFSSQELAQKMQEIALSGVGDIAFVIGSSHGLAPSIKQKATYKISISPMTFPHQLARLIITEQIYRAFMIQSGSKYHK